jgi:hypothetical protein
MPDLGRGFEYIAISLALLVMTMEKDHILFWGGIAVHLCPFSDLVHPLNKLLLPACNALPSGLSKHIF